MCYCGGSVRGDRTKESQMSQRTLQMFYVQCTLIRRWYSYVANYSSASGKRQSLYNVSLYQNKDSGLVHLQWMLNGSEQPWLWCSVLDTYLMLLNQFFFTLCGFMDFMMAELQMWLFVINAWEHPSGREHIPCVLYSLQVFSFSYHSAFELFLELFS